MSEPRYPLGAWVRLLTPNELFTGEVGVVVDHKTDHEDQLVHYVQFRLDEHAWPHNFNYHYTDELEPE